MNMHIYMTCTCPCRSPTDLLHVHVHGMCFNVRVADGRLSYALWFAGSGSISVRELIKVSG